MNEELKKSYDRVAEDYAEHFRDELDEKPFSTFKETCPSW